MDWASGFLAAARDTICRQVATPSPSSRARRNRDQEQVAGIPGFRFEKQRQQDGSGNRQRFFRHWRRFSSTAWGDLGIVGSLYVLVNVGPRSIPKT
jgi:hypothetical protein